MRLPGQQVPRQTYMAVEVSIAFLGAVCRRHSAV